MFLLLSVPWVDALHLPLGSDEARFCVSIDKACDFALELCLCLWYGSLHLDFPVWVARLSCLLSHFGKGSRSYLVALQGCDGALSGEAICRFAASSAGEPAMDVALASVRDFGLATFLMTPRYFLHRFCFVLFAGCLMDSCYQLSRMVGLQCGRLETFECCLSSIFRSFGELRFSCVSLLP